MQLNRGFWKVSDFGIECDLGFRVALRPVFWGIDELWEEMVRLNKWKLLSMHSTYPSFFL